MSTRKLDQGASSVVRTDSRQAVETAIGATKGDRNATWEDLTNNQTRQVRKWGSTCESAGDESGAKDPATTEKPPRSTAA
jgi:hypothetical protein